MPAMSVQKGSKYACSHCIVLKILKIFKYLQSDRVGWKAI